VVGDEPVDFAAQGPVVFAKRARRQELLQDVAPL
jgi:hypothetical protein